MPPLGQFMRLEQAAAEGAKQLSSSGVGAELAELFGGAAAEAAKTAMSPQKQRIVDATEALFRKVVDLAPQEHGGTLDWVVGGSAAANALAKARTIELLDPTMLPKIVPLRTIEIPPNAAQHIQDFVRPMGDIDVFPMNGFQGSPLWENMPITKDAKPALKRSRSDTDKLVNTVDLRLMEPEIAAIDYGGRTTFVMSPGQLMSNKMMHTLNFYRPITAPKLTGDFSHLLDAASKIYSDSELIRFGQLGLMRHEDRSMHMFGGDWYKTGLIQERFDGGDYLHDHFLSLPKERTSDIAKFNDFMRRVLESNESNGPFLTGMKVDSRQSLDVIRLLDRHQAPDEKRVIADFINGHSDLVRRLEAPGSLGQRRWKAQEPYQKPSDALLILVDRVPRDGWTEQLAQVDRFLSTHSHIPAVDKVFQRHPGLSDPLNQFFFRTTSNPFPGLSQTQADRFIADLAESIDKPAEKRTLDVFTKHRVAVPDDAVSVFLEKS